MAPGTVAGWRIELLDLAFGAASALPVDPHVKTRSRLQESVVTASLQLDQRERAESYAEQIVNWRRGTALADIALHCARRGDRAAAERCLTRAAAAAAERADDPNEQGWRRDRILARIAAVHHVLGRVQQANEITAAMAPAEARWIDVAQAEQLTAAEYDARVRAIDAALGGSVFEEARTALQTCVVLYRRFHADPVRRAQMAQRVENGFAKLPLDLRIELALATAAAAAEHGDGADAARLLGKAHELWRSGQWLPEQGIPMLARIAEVRVRAGDPAAGRADARAALRLFDAERNQTADIWRARTLRSIAEAYHAIGDRATALALHARTVEEGVVNPNSRPRAEDLCATCVSMAVRGFEPSAQLRARLLEVRQGLRDPW